MFAFFSRPGTSSLLNTKNELLRVTVTIRGTGHREVTFAVGELGPGFGNHPALLGGRPPYGYRLADAGPHPNRAHAAWGRRARRLEPDPLTAPNVTWIFAPAAGDLPRQCRKPQPVEPHRLAVNVPRGHRNKQE